MRESIFVSSISLIENHPPMMMNAENKNIRILLFSPAQAGIAAKRRMHQ